MKRYLQLAFSSALCAAGQTSQTLAAEAQLLFSTPAQVFLVEVTLASEAGKDAIVPLIFDTGAAATILDEVTLKALGATSLGAEAIMLPDGSAHQITRHRLASLQLGNCTLHNVDVYGSSAMVQGVLGLDFIGPLLPMTMTSEDISFTCPSIGSDMAAATEKDSL